MAKNKTVNTLQINFDEEKTRALRQFMAKKSLTIEQELFEYLTKLYEKYVPVQVREFVEPPQEKAVNVHSLGLQDKGDTPHKAEQPPKTPISRADR